METQTKKDDVDALDRIAELEALLESFKEGHYFGLPEHQEVDPFARLLIPLLIVEVDHELFECFAERVSEDNVRELMLVRNGEPIRYFWRQGDRCYMRLLTWEQSEHFCRLAEFPMSCMRQ